MAISPTRRVLTGAVAVLLVGAACSPPSSTHARGGAGDTDAAQFAAAADDERGTLLSEEPMELAEPLTDVGARGMRIKYQSTDADGAASEATGAVLVPSGPPPAGGWPVVSWGHGSLGRADACAPSQHADLMGYGATILPELVEAGYAVTASDYAGLGTPGTQPASWRSHAHDMIDAVRAANQLEVPLSDTWVAAGHSEGGGSAIATNEAVAEYGDGLDYRGAAAVAFSMPDVARQPDLLTTGGLLLLLADPQMQALWLNLLRGFKADHPELNLDDFLGPRAQELLPEVTSQCSVGPDSLIDTLNERQLPSQEFLPTDPANGDRLAELFASLNLPSSAGAVPMLHMIGENDALTPDPDVQRMRDGLCGQGVPTAMASVPGADHDGTLRAGADQVIEWMDQRIAGADPPDDC